MRGHIQITFRDIESEQSEILIAQLAECGYEGFEEVKMECGYRADLVIERKIIVDTKTVDGIADIHVAQILTYLRFLHLRHGLILNFNTTRLKDGIRRILNGFE